MPPSDEELARHAQDGDQEAFATLVNLYQRRIYGLALHLLRDAEDAADAAQESFVRCFSSLETFDSQRSFGAWLYRIAYNQCLDALRRKRRAPPEITSPEQQERATTRAADPGPGVEELVERSESIGAVSRALEALSDEQRVILTFRYTLDLSYGEIAEVLDVPESTVTMRLHHAKRALRAQLAGTGEDADASS